MLGSLKVYIGWDSHEEIAWEVANHSIRRHASRPLDVFPLKQETLRELGLYSRERDEKASTEFSITRFLTPYLAGTSEGWALFTDCDFLFTDDIHQVFDYVEGDKAVYVVQHDYIPSKQVKMDGAAQSIYPRKNWSSFMLFNLRHPAVKALTPQVVNEASPSYLHRFEWIKDDEQIGSLPLDFNFLEGEYPLPERTPRVIHYTNGGPWFADWQKVDYAELWNRERDDYLLTLSQ
jgi:lipopolysaccharide biosynthesis glycosyltransferase